MASMFFALLRLLRMIRRAYRDVEFRALLSIMILLLISGTVFYVAHEDWSYIDALYFCVMTMSTVGYGDLVPTTDLSKVFTIVYSLLTIGVFVGVVSKLALVATHHRRFRRGGIEAGAGDDHPQR